MKFTKNQIYIAVGAGVLLVLTFLGYLAWLNNQGPVLAKSEERDSLTGIPNSIRLNPLRDHASEKAAAAFSEAWSRSGFSRIEFGMPVKESRSSDLASTGPWLFNQAR